MKRVLKFCPGLLLLLLPCMSMAQVGNPAPDFMVTDINGSTHRLYDYLEAGKVVVLDFYYTTCGPCQFYSPQVNLAYSKYGCNTANVIFLSIDHNDTDAEVAAYDNEYAIEFPSISGLEGGGNAVVSQYQIIGFPTFYVIDSSKTIIENIDPPTLQVFDFRFAQHDILPASCTTSIEDAERVTENISFYPNPVPISESLHIELTESIYGEVRIEIYDFMGKLVQHKLVNDYGENNIDIEVQHLFPGMYFMNLHAVTSGQLCKGVFEVLDY